jgi:hypothetical protein
VNFNHLPKDHLGSELLCPFAEGLASLWCVYAVQPNLHIFERLAIEYSNRVAICDAYDFA